jgi:hypothetical protein
MDGWKRVSARDIVRNGDITRGLLGSEAWETSSVPSSSSVMEEGEVVAAGVALAEAGFFFVVPLVAVVFDEPD